MTIYETLHNGPYDLDELTVKEREFFNRVREYYQENPDWNEFANFWNREGGKIWGNKPIEEATESPIFKICQDMEARLGIEQGYTRLADYRDLLRELIIKNYSTVYKFCKKNRIREDLLSRVFNKKRNLSIETLQKILRPLHYQICFRRATSSDYKKAKDKTPELITV
jgi:hypothetical protein